VCGARISEKTFALAACCHSSRRQKAPIEGNSWLISLQFLLLREARAFLDTDLQAGMITGADALSLLKDDVVLSDAFAVSEVQRLANAGSGTAYFYGYSEFLRLRKDVEQVLGARFDQQRFHDFVMAQGKIPIPIIRQAIFERFLKSPS
jgi:uncharacterized protein (DUF885 family)